MNENLTQDEIETLLQGVDSGAVDTTPDALMDGEAEAYDFANQTRGANARMPMFDMVYDRFIRYMRNSMFNMLKRSTEITLAGVKLQNFHDYVQTLSAPVNLNLISVKPLRGTGLFVISPKLVFTVVDNFFGGDGRSNPPGAADREFTPSELRIIQLLLKHAFADLRKAWEPVFKLEFGHISSEINPQFINAISPTEVVLVSRFNMDIGGSAGEFHVVMPQAMLDPVREHMESGTKKTQETVDLRWRRSLTEELKSATVQLNSYTGYTKLSLGEVLNLNPGDVIPVRLPELVTVRAAKIPIFRGVLGISNGKNAIRYVESIPRQDYSQEKP